jgi:hypothetical protein
LIAKFILGSVRVLLVSVCAVVRSAVVAVSIAIVPVEVIVPPESPVPAVMLVTVPAAPLYANEVHAVEPLPIFTLPVSVS